MPHTVGGMRPFRIAVGQDELHDLHSRLARTRWPAQLPGAAWDRGVPLDWLRELADYWRTGYDWPAAERKLNEFPQFMTEIDGLDIHFLHVRSANPDALPLILSHGWPNSIVEFTDLIGHLTADFHVVAPSVPGFGFSGAPREPGFGVDDVGRIWAELMSRLGYQRYGSQGGDLGAYIAPAVARAAPSKVVGVHVNGGLGFPTEADVPGMSPAELADYAAIQQWTGAGVDHHSLLRVAPQTFAYGWQDSPVALLAWQAQKLKEFGDLVIDRDLLLTNTCVYWFTGTSGSSSWFMYNNRAFAWPRGQRAVPTGVYAGGPPLVRRLAEQQNKITHWPTGNPGGHFLAMHEPEALAADLRTFFRREA